MLKVIMNLLVLRGERYDNIRILKTKLENAVFEKLAEMFVLNPEA